MVWSENNEFRGVITLFFARSIGVYVMKFKEVKFKAIYSMSIDYIN